MIKNPTLLSIVLSLIIGIVTGLVTGLAMGSWAAAAVAFGTSVVSAFIVDWISSGRLFFREVKVLENRPGDEDDAYTPDVPQEGISRELDSMLAKKQEEIDRLKNLEVLRKNFIADVSHELKTPIFAAQGFLHTLLDGAAGEKAVRKKFLKKAAKSIDSLDALVQDLLTLSQIETGQIRMRFENFDLYALAQEVFDQFKRKARKKDITLRIEGTRRSIRAFGDPRRIGQVLSNLISNAIMHSPDGSEVIVQFRATPGGVITSVIDTGEGIPAEHIERVFERFYRVEQSRSRDKGGTGLGLAIVKHILEGHQTKAEVDSEPGKGSTFSFRLPRENTQNGIGEHNRQAEGEDLKAED